MKNFEEINKNNLDNINGGHWWNTVGSIAERTEQDVANGVNSYLGSQIGGKIILDIVDMIPDFA